MGSAARSSRIGRSSTTVDASATTRTAFLFRSFDGSSSAGAGAAGRSGALPWDRSGSRMRAETPVSYTHLTLPTKA